MSRWFDKENLIYIFVDFHTVKHKMFNLTRLSSKCTAVSSEFKIVVKKQREKAFCCVEMNKGEVHTGKM